MERHHGNNHQDKLQASLDTLEQAVAGLHDSDTFRRYLDVQARFHRYSWGNCMLIAMQKPDATRIAGYKTWASLGRHVMKGEQAIRIIAPGSYKRPERDDQGTDTEREVTFFRAVPVFDISQTEGKPLPAVAVPVLQGEEGAELYDRMATLSQEEGFRLITEDPRLGGDTLGFCDPDEKVIGVRDAPQRQRTKTLAHELAHHFGGHQSSNPETETTAESVAYVVLAHHGVDSGARSFPYIATWARDTAVLRAALGAIQGLSATIIDRLTPLHASAGPSTDPNPGLSAEAGPGLGGCASH